ncbi:MAG: hypothetical protein BroJett038_28270 [Chloroflexota bacterium]|nr:MAG: hypothetical protein BroJett038_28270 [Chloroflexota bacterium]
MSSPYEVLESVYQKALQQPPSALSPAQQERVKTIVDFAETQKAVLAAVLTSLAKKLVSPEQDVRQHKVELPGGYSGRVFDTNYVTPFIREKFPRLAMHSGSGWLTRSIEQLHPFTLDFPGRIRNSHLKRAFLEILDDIETQGTSAEAYLLALFQALVAEQEQTYIRFERRVEGHVTVDSVVQALGLHFNYDYRAAGASRLPVLAIYAVYRLLMTLPRYDGKNLLPLKSHTTSDTKSGSIGDIEITGKDGQFFEAVEVKFGRPITLAMVEDAFGKIESLPVSRYYLLTTAEPNALQTAEIADFVNKVYKQHGCEMIVNGVIPTLKYYLRLLDNPAAFIDAYESCLSDEVESNTDLKLAHIQRWQELRHRFGV